MNHKTLNISNFENYIIDYFDGKLSKDKQHALFAFLEIHPQLMADFELFKQCQNLVIQPDTFPFPCPEKLKKNVVFSVNDVNESNYQNYFIAFYENDLDKSTRQMLSAFLEKNTFLMSEFESFGKLRLVSDNNVVFKDKRRLKHRTSRFSSAIWIAAASVAAILLLFFLFKPGLETPSSSVIHKPIFAQTNDNEPETVSDTATVLPLPTDNIISERKLSPKSKRISPTVHIEKVIASADDPNEELDHEPLLSEQNTEVVTSDTFKILEPEVVLIKTISDTESIKNDLLTVSQELQQKKRSFWKILSWGVKQYNHITNDDVAIVKVENLTTYETVYYLCRGE